MTSFLNYFIPGITDGSVYALAALGLVLTYKTSGVFNFAHGAVAAAAAYLFYQGYVEWNWPWPLAFLFSLAIVGILGGLVMAQLARLLSTAPTVMTVVATVGLLVLISSLMTAIFGASDKKSGDFLPTRGPTVGDVTISYGEMMITAFGIAAALALMLFFGKTRLGRATTAVVDDPHLLSLAKINPDAVRRLSWVVGASFASISGMLLAPKLGVSVGVLVLIVIAAYGAAALGLFENLLWTLLGAFGIGILINYTPRLFAHTDSYFLNSIPRNIPFLVLLLVFMVVPARHLQERGVRNVRTLAPPRDLPKLWNAAGLAALLVAAILVPQVVADYNITVYAAALGFTIIFLSLGMLIWTSGQISLCHMGFAALGATTAGKLTTVGFWHWLPGIGGHHASWPLAVFLAGLIVVPMGAIVAIPAIRLAGIYVAIATFGFGILLEQSFYLAPVMFDSGALVQNPRPGTDYTLPTTAHRLTTVDGHLGGVFGISFESDKRYYYLALMVTVLMAVIVLLIRRARLGTLLRALADSPTALETHAANTTVMRVSVFALSAFMAGVGGAVVAGATQNASGAPGGTFDYTVSLIFVAVLGFCGRRPILSPVLAAVAYQVVKIYAPFDKQWAIEYRGVAFGALAILVAIWPALKVGESLKQRGINLPTLPRSAGPAEPAGGHRMSRSRRAASAEFVDDPNDFDPWDRPRRTAEPEGPPPSATAEALDGTHA
jgi:branched-subunit amino acid ABC-type transport system permease component